jgi:hypothetical protein
VRSIGYLTVLAMILMPLAGAYACDDFDEEMAVLAAQNSPIAQSQLAKQEPPAPTSEQQSSGSGAVVGTPLTLVSHPAPASAELVGQLQP